MQNFKNEYNFVVDVRCFTYNQSKYITDTMDGFCSQQTNFPFVCLIVDDASTDGEQDVIRSYLETHFDFSQKVGSFYKEKETDYAYITFARHKVNRNCFFVVWFLKENHYSDSMLREKKFGYIAQWRDCCLFEAFCEGDDYWIDPLKLQKQISYLKLHKKCRYVFTARYVDFEQNNLRVEQRYKKKVYTTHDILAGFNPGIQNVVWYVEDVKKMNDFKGINGDRLFPYLASLRGEIHYIDDVTSVYRVTGEGVSTKIDSKARFEHSSRDFFEFHKKLNFPDKKAFLKGESRYLVHNLTLYPIFKIPLEALKCYKVLKSIYGELNIIDYLYMILIHVASKLLKIFGLGYIKTKTIKK